MKPTLRKSAGNRRGMIIVLSAVLMVVMLAMVAFCVDLGYVAMSHAQLQAAADAAALAAAGASNQSPSGMVQIAQAFAQYHQVAGRTVQLGSSDVKFGTWDAATGTFAELPSGQLGTAVKVTVRADSANGGAIPLFFGRAVGGTSVSASASAIAAVNPRDIAFVVDCSGSMNFDSTPGSSSASTTYIQQLYDDFGWGTYPGTLTNKTWINSSDDTQLKSWMNGQLKTAMPNAVPAIDTSSSDSKAYWKAYYDNMAGGQVGYKSYLQFIEPKGRDTPVVTARKDIQGNVTQQALYSPLSTNNPTYTKRTESTDGGTFTFPVREMPTHAVRRAIIAALALIRDRNVQIVSSSQKDHVSLIVFDQKNTGSDKTHVRVLCPLTDDYTSVMTAAATLQACNSSVNCTDSEGGLICAYDHIKAASLGGSGRESANKVILFLTDGNANLYESSNGDIDTYKSQHPSSTNWDNDYPSNGAIMQSSKFQGTNGSMYAVGVGRGGDQAFMDRMARSAGTAINNAAYPIASDAATYETTLKSIFSRIVTNPKLRLVQ